MNIKLTKLQAEIVQHRLDEPDCIAEVLGGEGYNLPEAEVMEACESLSRGLPYLPMSTELSPVGKEVLAETIEGSTFMACSESAFDSGEISSQELTSHRRAMEAVARAVESVVGRKLYCPFA